MRVVGCRVYFSLFRVHCLSYRQRRGFRVSLRVVVGYITFSRCRGRRLRVWAAGCRRGLGFRRGARVGGGGRVPFALLPPRVPHTYTPSRQPPLSFLATLPPVPRFPTRAHLPPHSAPATLLPSDLPAMQAAPPPSSFPATLPPAWGSGCEVRSA